MESVFRLGVVFRVVDRFTGPMRGMGRLIDQNRAKLRQLGQSFRSLGTRALIAGTIAAAAATAPAVAFGKFEAELAAVGAMTGATEKQMRRLERTAIQLGIETEHSPQAVIEAFRALSAQGLTLDQQFRAIRPTLLLATAGQLNLAEAATTTASALNAFQLGADQTQRVVDVLMKGTTISALKADEYALALGSLGPAASASNQDFEQMIAFLGAFRSKGLTAQDAAFKIRMALIALQAPSSEAQRLIDRLGIRLRDQRGEMLPFADIIDSVQGAIGHLDKALQDQVLETLLGARAAQAYHAATQAAFTDPSGKVLRGTAAIRAMTRELKQAQGAADLFAKAFLETFAGKTELLKGSISTLALTFGRFTAGALKPFVIWATTALNKMIEWGQANPAAARKLGTLAVWVSGLTLALGGLALGLGVVFGAIALLGGPVTLIIAGVALLGAAVGTLAVYWQDVAGWARRAGRALREGFLADMVRLREELGRLGRLIAGAFQRAWDSVTSGFARATAWLLEKAAAVTAALPGWAVPEGLSPGALRETARGLRELGATPPALGPARVAAERAALPRVPAVTRAPERVEIGQLGPQGRNTEVHIGTLQLSNVRNAQEFLDELEALSGGMVTAEP